MSVEPRFDELVHAPQRLRIVAMLDPVGGLDFGVLRDALDVSDSVLSKHLKVLQDAGYATVAKVRRAGHVWTTVALTRDGRRAYAGHVAALREIVATPDPEPPDA
ncbi:transcriptional regulator [Luteimicrobium subarcticum]|uniref:Winged helix DNA-binding protein n=1 Tax=Luteimicrobium subarcticum TaxID=620910 RepID=A0A2M8WJ67_9MICO|nr:transcriptional regulator [Luteimicrobium subarcticum]PJI90938.1 winged helix DNA-binding protein [Luteimicrobium subarcticum]